MSLQLLCFLLQLFFLNASCFMRQMVVQFAVFSHPWNWVSFSRFELRIESLFDFERTCASLVVCGHAFRFVFSFPNLRLFFSLFLIFLSLSQSRKVGDGIRSLALRENAQKKSRAFSHKTTVSWLCVSVHFGIFIFQISFFLRLDSNIEWKSSNNRGAVV